MNGSMGFTRRMDHRDRRGCGVMFRFHATCQWNSVSNRAVSCRLFMSDSNLVSEAAPMVNLYREWSLNDDRTLWEHRHLPLAELACRLGRGLRGVESRVSKLKDVSSLAYSRLFADNDSDSARVDRSNTDKPSKLVPVSEVLRRIQWDVMLPEEKFSILYYDRVEDKTVEASLMATNDAVKGPATKLIDAIPEHRIVAVKYLERVVWDRENRLDHVFSNPGIITVMETYEDWKLQRDAEMEQNRLRMEDVSNAIGQMLGLHRFQAFGECLDSLQSFVPTPSKSLKSEVEESVGTLTRLFRLARDDPDTSLVPSLIPRTDIEALDTISELVSLLPEESLKNILLKELEQAMTRLQGKSATTSRIQQELPELREDDLLETFVRGSGPGGQKINKTSNRVVLVHTPTQIRVECQETRSLQQNRKIARNRLKLKLDEYLNGSQSRERMKAERAASKKAKAKARSRARQRRKWGDKADAGKSAQE